MPRRQHRLRRLEQRLGALPVSHEAAQRAFLHFGATGELPDDPKVARAVVTRANTGIDETAYGPDQFSQQALVRAHIQAASVELDEIMNALRKEAIYADEFVRELARDFLRGLADLGADVTTQVFRDRGISELKNQWCSSTALTLAGFPGILAVEPYEERAKMLFANLEALRETVDTDDPGWMDAYFDAIGSFRDDGTLPSDPLMRDAVLADAEVVGLMRCCLGHGDPELMAAIAVCDVDSGAGREAAIERLQAMAAEGRLMTLPQVPESIIG